MRFHRIGKVCTAEPHIRPLPLDDICGGLGDNNNKKVKGRFGLEGLAFQFSKGKGGVLIKSSVAPHPPPKSNSQSTLSRYAVLQACEDRLRSETRGTMAYVCKESQGC